MNIQFRPVGVVKIKASDDEVRTGRRKDREGELEIYPEFAEALEGIDGFSHLFILCYFNRLRPDQIGPLKVRPTRLVKRGFELEELPLLGCFSLDSPTRPNPIGLTLVRLLRRDDNRLTVSGLDFFDGTPILDLKAYRPAYRTEDYNLPSWCRMLENGKV